MTQPVIDPTNNSKITASTKDLYNNTTNKRGFRVGADIDLLEILATDNYIWEPSNNIYSLTYEYSNSIVIHPINDSSTINNIIIDDLNGDPIINAIRSDSIVTSIFYIVNSKC